MTDNELYDLSDEELEQEVRRLRSEEPKEETSEAEEIPANDEENSIPQEDEEDSTTEDNSEQSEEPESDETEEAFNEEDNIDEESEEKPEEDNSIDDSKYEVQANGRTYQFTIDEMKKLSSAGMNYTKKTQELAPYRKTISAMRDNGLSQEDINLLIDIKKGNKEALQSFIKSTGVDVFDLENNLDEEDGASTSYTPNDYGATYEQEEVNSVLTSLSQEPEFATTSEILGRLDNKSIDFFKKNPQAITDLHTDVKSGTFNKVMPEAEKLAALDGYSKPMLNYYFNAGQQLLSKEQELSKQNKQIEQEKQKKVRNKKKSASLPSNSYGGKSQPDYTVIDDEEYLNWYNSLAN